MRLFARCFVHTAAVDYSPKIINRSGSLTSVLSKGHNSVVIDMRVVFNSNRTNFLQILKKHYRCVTRDER